MELRQTTQAPLPAIHEKDCRKHQQLNARKANPAEGPTPVQKLTYRDTLSQIYVQPLKHSTGTPVRGLSRTVETPQKQQPQPAQHLKSKALHSHLVKASEVLSTRANDLQFRGTALSGPRFQHKTTSGLAPPSPKRYQNETHTTKRPKCVGQDTVLNIRVKASCLKASFCL